MTEKKCICLIAVVAATSRTRDVQNHEPHEVMKTDEDDVVAGEKNCTKIRHKHTHTHKRP